MRYKILGLFACIAILLTAAVATLYANPAPGRVHQHLTAARYTPCKDHGDETFCTHLPIVKIETGGDIIPGRVYNGEDGEKTYETSRDGSDRITADMSVIDGGQGHNHLSDAPELMSRVSIHVRGHSSRVFDKSSYSIKLIHEDGTENPQMVMGMDADEEWILNGPFLDKTLMRNYMWYNIAGEIMDYAPNVRFCEVFLNGEYDGLYVMTERITAGKNGARLQLSVNKKDNTYTGYLLCLDWEETATHTIANNFTSYTFKNFNALEILFPGKKNLTPELERMITQDFSDFEKALYSYDFNSKDYGYKQLIDVDSFVNYFLINEFTCNYDAGNLSTYIYRDIDGRFRMVVWDFNNSCDNYQESAIPIDSFQPNNSLWTLMLVKDKEFTERIISRYRELRKSYLSEEYLNKYIDEVIDYLGPAIERNFERWGYTFSEDFELLQPAERNPHSYEEAVEDLKAFLHERGNNLDTDIESVRQYSEESRTRKFLHDAN